MYEYACYVNGKIVDYIWADNYREAFELVQEMYGPHAQVERLPEDNDVMY